MLYDSTISFLFDFYGSYVLNDLVDDDHDHVDVTVPKTTVPQISTQ